MRPTLPAAAATRGLAGTAPIAWWLVVRRSRRPPSDREAVVVRRLAALLGVRYLAETAAIMTGRYARRDLRLEVEALHAATMGVATVLAPRARRASAMALALSALVITGEVATRRHGTKGES